MNKCKCCDEVIRSQVDRMILDGVSDDRISRALASIGVDVTKTSVLRHRQNHYTPPTNPVEYHPDIDIPAKASVELFQPIGDAGDLLDDIRATVDSNAVDITRDRLVRETLLARILEKQLAITDKALARYQAGEGRYPLDMIRGLTSLEQIFEKTLLHEIAVKDTKRHLFNREIKRRENDAFEMAKQRVLSGSRDFSLPEEILPATRNVEFGGFWMTSVEYNERIRIAWNHGIQIGLKGGASDTDPD